MQRGTQVIIYDRSVQVAWIFAQCNFVSHWENFAFSCLLLLQDSFLLLYVTTYILYVLPWDGYCLVWLFVFYYTQVWVQM